MSVRLLVGDTRQILPTLPDASVQCVVTSPPYFGLRDYGVAGQIGLEQTPAEYVEQMVAVFREVRRVLRDDGTVWLNLGDSYAANGGPGAGGNAERMGRAYQQRNVRPNCKYDGLKAKDLLGIPWRVAFALQADGWWLRSDIIWAKPNPMPESVTDRPTSAHEHVFLLAKRERYFYDAEAVREPATSDRPDMRLKGIRTGQAYLQQGPIADNTTAARERASPRSAELDTSAVDATGRNCRNVWTIATAPYAEAHFATFPPDLAERCIKAGSRPGDTVLDPFGGAGTTGLVADRLGRDALLIELNPAYAKLAENRIRDDMPLFADVA